MFKSKAGVCEQCYISYTYTMHEGRSISNANAYEGKWNKPKQNKRSTVENAILSPVAVSIKLLILFLWVIITVNVKRINYNLRSWWSTY